MSEGSGFGTFIKQQRLARGIKLREAAKLAGVSHARLSEIEKGAGYHTLRPTRPSRPVVERLALAYALPLGPLLAMAGYDSSEKASLAPEALEVVALFQALNPARKRLALAMMRTFAGDEAMGGTELS